MRKTKWAAFAASCLVASGLLCGFDSALTAEDLYQKEQEAASTQDSVNMDIQLLADASLLIGSDPATGTMVPLQGQADFHVSYQLEPLAMKLDGTISGSAVGQNLHAVMEEYLITNEDGTGSAYVYMKEDAPDGTESETEDPTAGWNASKIPAEQMKTIQDAISASKTGDYSKLNEKGLDVEAIQDKMMSSVVLSPNPVTEKGQECYEMTSSLSGDQMTDLFDQVLQMMKKEDTKGSLSALPEDQLKTILSSLQVDTKSLINTETFLPVYAEADLSGTDFSWISDLISQGTGGGESESSVPQISVTANTLKATAAYDYDSPVSIELPDEVKSLPVEEPVLTDLESEVGSVIGGSDGPTSITLADQAE